MASFHDVRLPVDVERGAKGGPRFKTAIAELQSGFEKRNSDWSEQRCEYDISYGIGTKQAYILTLAFFYARRGRAFGFRFKDWADYQITGGVVGIGNGTNKKFQITKTYSDAGGSFVRTIYKPVAGTLNVYDNGVLKTLTTDYTIDYTTGIISFVTAPVNTHAISVDVQFDVPVRFDTDAMDVSMEWVNAGQVSSIPLVELRIKSSLV